MQKTQTIEINNEVWDKYQETKSLTIRNKILTNYLYIITVNAKRMSAVFRNKADLEDIVNQGVIALIDCIERYDWRRGVQFDSFASIRIRGSIIDYMRKQDWVPRDVRKTSTNIENVCTQLQAVLNRPPTDEEVAQSIGMDIQEYHKNISQVHSFYMVSYEELLNNTTNIKEPVSSIEAPEQKLQQEELKEIIADSIDELNEKERLIVSLYYYEELKLKEIAVILGLTCSRVSQIHTNALLKMKKKLSEYLIE